MAKHFKIKKRKKVKTWLAKLMNRVVLPAFLGGLVVAMGIIFLLLAFDLPETVYIIATAVYFVLLFAAAGVIIFVVVPRYRAAQALRDYENYDFTPYTPTDSETFSHTLPTEKYYFTPSPFDDDEGITELKSGKAAADYFAQFSQDRLKMFESLQDGGAFIPFNVVDFGDTYFQGTVEKRKEGEYVTVTVIQKPEITFGSDGVHLGGQLFKYEECSAVVSAGFIQSEACASISVLLVLSDECAAVFAFGSRIAAVIDKYKIRVENREIFDFILSDPRAAFRQVGLKRRLKIKKNDHTALQ